MVISEIGENEADWRAKRVLSREVDGNYAFPHMPILYVHNLESTPKIKQTCLEKKKMVILENSS